MHLSRGASAPVPRDEASTQILSKAKGNGAGTNMVFVPDQWTG